MTRIRTVVTLMSCALLAVSPAVAAAIFPNPAYPVGSNPLGLATADFDGDGVQDMVVSNWGTYSSQGWSLSVLMGRTDGTFADEIRIPLDRAPYNVLAADLDNDGHGDLLIHYYSDVVSRLGRGDGSFGPESLVARNVYRARLANFNDDGRADLFVEHYSATNTFLEPLLGNGDGTFLATGGIAAPSSFNAIAADLNGDRRDDVVTLTTDFNYRNNDILVYLAASDGSFAAAPSFTTGHYATEVFPLDADGDGVTDLAATYTYDNPDGVGRAFTIYFGNGDGTFDAGLVELATIALQFVADDFNEDGLQDFAAGDGMGVTVHLGRGHRRYAPLPRVLVGYQVQRMIAPDLDRDGHADLVVLGTSSEAVLTYFGAGDGTFVPHLRSDVSHSFGIVSGDFNEDGVTDLAATNWETDDTAILIGRGDGTFQRATRYGTAIDPVDVATGDFDRDGHTDLAVLADNRPGGEGAAALGSVVVLPGSSDGTFGKGATFAVGLSPGKLTVADLNGDGFQDILTANQQWGSPGTRGDLSLLLNRGDGSFAAEIRLGVGSESYPPYGGTIPNDLATGDFNRDGRVDIAVAMSGLTVPGQFVVGGLRLLFNQGNGSFAPPVTVATLVDALSVAVGDFNKDGFDDLAVTDGGEPEHDIPGGVYVLMGRGDGTFGSSGLLPAGIAPNNVTIADLDGDAVSDLAMVSFGYLVTLHGFGDGTFGQRRNFSLAGWAPIAAADFNGDGRSDIAGVSESGTFVLDNRQAPLSINALLTPGSPLGGSSATLTWTTSAEHDLVGFNAVWIDTHGAHQLNPVLIPCEECVTGAGRTYVTYLPRHKSGKNVYVQAVHLNGAIQTFGPARKE